MTHEDTELAKLEAAFPSLSGQAFATARRQTLEAGESVLQAESGIIYRVFPDGKKEKVKEIQKPKRMKIGTRFVIK